MLDAMELPWYRCHKEVRALKIAEVRANHQLMDGTVTFEMVSGTIVPDDKDYAEFNVSAEYMTKHKPQAGGYFVVYDDGYQSWSPAKAFEDGYTLISK